MSKFSNSINRFEKINNITGLYWLTSKKNYQYKSTNVIVGSFKDLLINQKTYISNNGIYQNIYFHKELLVNNLVNYDKRKQVLPVNRFFKESYILPFISYFFTINNNLNKLDLYSITYFKKKMKLFKNKQKFVTIYSNYSLLEKNTQKFNMYNIRLKISDLKFSTLIKVRYRKRFIFKYNKKFRTITRRQVKLRRKRWKRKRKYSFFITNTGWVRNFKKRSRLHKRLDAWGKHRRKIKRYAVRAKFKIFLRFYKNFLKFVSNFSLLKVTSIIYLRNFMIFFGYIRGIVEFLDTNIRSYKVGKYRYDKKLRKKTYQQTLYGTKLFKTRPLYTMYKYGNRLLGFYKLTVYLKNYIVNHFLNIKQKENIFLKKALFNIFFFKNNNFKMFQTSQINDELYYDNSLEFLFKNNTELDNDYLYIIYNMFSSFFYWENINYIKKNIFILKQFFLNNFLNKYLVENNSINFLTNSTYKNIYYSVYMTVIKLKKKIKYQVNLEKSILNSFSSNMQGTALKINYFKSLYCNKKLRRKLFNYLQFKYRYVKKNKKKYILISKKQKYVFKKGFFTSIIKNMKNRRILKKLKYKMKKKKKNMKTAIKKDGRIEWKNVRYLNKKVEIFFMKDAILPIRILKKYNDEKHRITALAKRNNWLTKLKKKNKLPPKTFILTEIQNYATAAAKTGKRFNEKFCLKYYDDFVEKYKIKHKIRREKKSNFLKNIKREEWVLKKDRKNKYHNQKLQNSAKKHNWQNNAKKQAKQSLNSIIDKQKIDHLKNDRKNIKVLNLKKKNSTYYKKGGNNKKNLKSKKN